MHIMIIGNSASGKSNLAKRFALDANNRGETVIVYDPLLSVGWPGQLKYATAETFLAQIEHHQSAHVFIDEARTLWDHDQKLANALLYQKRHQGLLIYLIAQRTRMVPPNARNQCSKLFAFRQQKDDAETLAQEYHAEMMQTSALKIGEFIASDGYRSQRFHLDYKVYPPTVVPA